MQQQPMQFQNIAGPGQVVPLPFNGNPGQPLYYVGNPYPQQQYIQDPVKMAYVTLPTQPYPTSFVPQTYGGNMLPTPQQPVMVVQQQPTPVPISTAVQTSSGDNYLTLSVLMTFLVLIIGGWPSLLCTISALLMAYSAKDEEKRGNIAAARTKANMSLGLNIAAVLFVVVMWSVVAIPVAVTVSAQNQASPYCYQVYSYFYYCTRTFCYYSSCSYYNYYSYSPEYYSYSYSDGYVSSYCGSTSSLACTYGG